MGYTHYFRYQPTAAGFVTAWPRIVNDTRRICQAVTAAGIVLAGPLGTGAPILDIHDGIELNGSAGRGEDYETFTILPPDLAASNDQPWFCKTERRPYDLAVTTILLRCRLLAPDDFSIASDGTWSQWATASEPGLPSTHELLTDLLGPTPTLPSWDLI